MCEGVSEGGTEKEREGERGGMKERVLSSLFTSLRSSRFLQILKMAPSSDGRYRQFISLDLTIVRP